VAYTKICIKCGKPSNKEEKMNSTKCPPGKLEKKSPEKNVPMK